MCAKDQNQEYLKKSICPLDCPDSCGVLATVKNGHIISLQGDPAHPYTSGFICRKMRRYPERLYSEDRLLFPQVRIGKKGAGEFRRVEWEEALELCAKKLLNIRDEFGGEAILPYSYAGNMGAVNRFAGFPLFHKLGALQCKQTICSATAGVGWRKHCGDLQGCPPENAAESELIVAWGINIKVSNVHFWQYVSRARKSGAKLLVVDPYRNQTGKSADIFVQVKPGGDTGLALGICKLLIAEGSMDLGFIESSTTGFSQLSEYLQSQDISRFVAESGVELDVMQKMAAVFAASPKTFIRIGIGISRNSRGGMSIRSITSLAAVLGLYSGGPGRGVLLTTGAFRGDGEVLVHKKLMQEETGLVNMIHLGQVLNTQSPPVRGLVVYNSNPLSVNPDASSVRKGLAREDLFTVVHEQVMTPTAAYADVLLPATTFLENHDLYSAYGHFYLGVAKPVIAPLGEAKSNFDFFQELAKKMGFEDPPFAESCEERISNYLLSMEEIDPGMEFEAIMEGSYCHSVRSMKSGRLLGDGEKKFSFSVTTLPEEPAIACLSAAGEGGDPDLQARFPLHLITPPHPDLLNSTFGERFKGVAGDVLVHPEDAVIYRVQDGEAVVVENHRGRAKRIARITTDTAQGVLVAEGIFWPVALGDRDDSIQTGINDLTSQKTADMGEGATFHESLVRLVPISVVA